MFASHVRLPFSVHHKRFFAILNNRKMKIAVEGCCHGELDAIYHHVGQLEERHKSKIDALLICGDFQAVRNHQDLQCMAVPNKYKHIQDFYKYYTGEKKAPILTIVIGGNHEASNYMSELYHGGWLAPKIYFLGCAGSVLLDGIRIAGASGIFNASHFRLGHYEKVPYSSNSMRSVYHIREFNVRRLSLLPSTRIFLSHDWPQSIEHHGDLNGLLQRKTFLKGDIQKGTLGSPPLMGLLRSLQPEWWFSAHLHTRYEASVVHDAPSRLDVSKDNPDDASLSFKELHDEPINPDEIRLDDEEDYVHAPPSVPSPLAVTKFLALDKCLPKRHFLEVVDIDPPEYLDSSKNSGPLLSFDPEWLAITRALHPWFSTSEHQQPFPEEAEARRLVAKERDWVSTNIKTSPGGKIPISTFQKFVMTAPGPGKEGTHKLQQPSWYKNPQTEAFCQMLGIPNLIDSHYHSAGSTGIQDTDLKT